jgi:flagellar hook-associated protein 2
MPEGFDLGISGLASSFDWRSFIDRMSEVERLPQQRMLLEQQGIEGRKVAYGSIATQLSVLHNRVLDLNDPDLYEARGATSSEPDFATGSVTAGASLGSYAFHVTQRATASVRQGLANIASPLSPTTDVSALTLSATAFPSVVKAGTFTVNGKQVTIATTDTLQAVFDRIHSATGNDVTASYDPTADKITLTSASSAQIVLGSAADTSNFLQVVKLANNGTATTSSSSSLGSIAFTKTLSAANLATPITDGGAGAGVFKINGVEIAYKASVDTIGDVLQRINNSTAGVSASYDSVHDRFLLTNKATGDLGLGFEDVTGNFLAATGLAGGTLQRGQELLYTLNGGGQLSSHSNVITADTSGVTGLSVTVLEAGDFTIETANDTSKLKQAITDFIADYNKAQALIDTNTASSTDAKGKVTAGTLAGEGDVSSLAFELRRQVNATFSFLTGTLKRVEGLGITSNGDNNNLALSDAAKLDKALAENLAEVKDLFTHDTTGLAVTLDKYLEHVAGEDGTLVEKQDLLTRQAGDIDEHISEQERLVQTNRDALILSFLAMEQAQARINQQMQFLAQRFGSGSNS